MQVSVERLSNVAWPAVACGASVSLLVKILWLSEPGALVLAAGRLSIALASAMVALSALQAVAGSNSSRRGIGRFRVRFSLLLLWVSLVSSILGIFGLAFTFSDAPFLIGLLVASERTLRSRPKSDQGSAAG